MYVSRTEDEDGNAAFEFRDKRNLVVLVRQVVPTGIGREFHDTYYLYDTAGNLRAVLPPMASASMQDGGPWSSDTSEVLRRYAYLYRYDGRNRCVAKRLPGADWIRIIYDRTDTPVVRRCPEFVPVHRIPHRLPRKPCVPFRPTKRRGCLPDTVSKA